MIGKNIFFDENKNDKTRNHKQGQNQEQTDSEISGTLQNAPEKTKSKTKKPQYYKDKGN